MFVVVMVFTSCDTENADLVSKMTNNESKEWIEVDSSQTKPLTTITFHKNGTFDNGFSTKNEWEFVDDGIIFKTRIEDGPSRSPTSFAR